MKIPLKLNLGCGTDYRSGWVNVDWSAKVEKDIQCDLSEFPWPWNDKSCAQVCMNHVLEHLPDTLATLREIQRVLIPGGCFSGQVPFAFSHTAFTQPDHCHYFLPDSFKAMAEFCGFGIVTIEAGVYSSHLRYRLRNLIPARGLLSKFFLNMYDVVDFELRKTCA